MKPLVSIMIPTYNQENFIKRAIESALFQTYKNIEIIISDDSINNKTEELIKKYYYDNEKIRYYHNIPSKGKTNNYRYMLYNLVKGKYAVNLDGDDYFIDKNFIKDSVEIFNKFSDLVMVVAKQEILKVNEGRIIKPKNFDEEILIKNGKKVFLDSIFKNLEIPHLATIYNVELAKKIGFYEYDIPSMDRESLLKLSLHGKVGILNRIVGVWVHHNNNISQNLDFETLLENIKMYDRLYEYALVHGINKFVLKIWKLLAKYKSLYGYIVSNNNKTIIKKLRNTNYKLYSYLLKLDPRLKRL